MASFTRSIARKTALGITAAAAMLTSASAADFTQDQCKVIKGTATEVVKTVGKDTLSIEFRQSFLNWVGRDMRCDGPKEISIVTHNDSVTYGTIRSALLAGSKPISLEKAGLRATIISKDVVSAEPSVQKRGDASAAPALN